VWTHLCRMCVDSYVSDVCGLICVGCVVCGLICVGCGGVWTLLCRMCVDSYVCALRAPCC
jgi:hypothetical protein